MYEVNDEFYLRIPLNPINILNIDNNIFDYCKENFMENIVINSLILFFNSSIICFLFIGSKLSFITGTISIGSLILMLYLVKSKTNFFKQE